LQCFVFYNSFQVDTFKARSEPVHGTQKIRALKAKAYQQLINSELN